MIRVALALLVLVGLAAESQACGRCGLFGNRCKFAHIVAAPLVVKSPEVLVIQNAFAQPNGLALLANQGSTAYGLQAAAQAYTLDPAAVLRQAAELTKGAQALAADGLSGYNSTANLALQLNASTNDTLAKGTAAAMVLQSAGLNQPSSGTQSQALHITRDAEGKWQVLPGTPQSVAQRLEQRESPQPQAAGLLTAKCSKCHGLDMAEPKGGLYFASGSAIDCGAALTAIDAIVAGRMPKGQQLTAEDLTGLVKELTQLGASK